MELLSEDLAQAYPELEKVMQQAKVAAISFKNHKVLLKVLLDIQKAAGSTPLRVYVPANTRKWSSSYLVICRMLRLKPFITLLHKDLPVPQIDWASFEATKEILFQFYSREQILQRDVSNAIHLAFFWRGLTKMIEKAIELHPGTEATDRLKERMNTHNKKMHSSSVYSLCLALWPTPSLTVVENKQAFKELSSLISCQYNMLVMYREAVCLPFNYDEKTKDSFFLEAHANLTLHLQPDVAEITLAKKYFKQVSEKAEHGLREGERFPRKSASTPICNIAKYWQSVAIDMPALSVIVWVLTKCAATEAGAERFFSTEAAVHGKLRNRLRFDLVKAILKIHWNWDALFGVADEEEDVEELI